MLVWLCAFALYENVCVCICACVRMYGVVHVCMPRETCFMKIVETVEKKLTANHHGVLVPYVDER